MAMFLPSNVLHSLTFRKTGADLVTAIERKIVELSASVEIRKGRIVALRREEKIDDRLWAALLEAERTASRSANYYSISVADAGREAEPGQTEIRIRAGVVADLRAEGEEMRKENDMRERITMIARNLDSAASYTLDETDLKFLGY